MKHSAGIPKVNLFVVGSMKAGTTSLFSWFAQHPDVYAPPIKEPHFFMEAMSDRMYQKPLFWDIERYFGQGSLEPLHIAHVHRAEHYAQLYGQARGKKYLLDASSMYLWSQPSATKISDYNPESKIIILVRSPIDRAYSHFKMDSSLGRESRSFEVAMRASLDEALIEPGAFNYVTLGAYDQGIERYEAAFGKSVLVMRFEELVKSESEVMSRLCAFLEIAYLEEPLPVQNQSREVRLRSGFYWFRKLGFKALYSFLVPTPVRRQVYHWLSKSAEGYELSPELLSRLRDYYDHQCSYYAGSW